MDHVQELKSRLFWIAIFFMAFSGVAYSYFPELSKILLMPLGNEQLYYMSPAGGLSFILKVCMYVGLIACMPVIIYHIYKFVSPVLKKSTISAVLGFTSASVILALCGIAFAYFISLPAALHFLTNVTVEQITAMITIDSYLSFVIAYLFAGALLFQLPLLLLTIDSITPLPPRKLMSSQRHMIVISFILAAIISPTPDVINQSILAVPMIVMYQLGIVLVWWRHALKRRRAAGSVKEELASGIVEELPTLADYEMPSAAVIVEPRTVIVPSQRAMRRSVDGFNRTAMPAGRTAPLVVPPRTEAGRPIVTTAKRSVDGILS